MIPYSAMAGCPPPSAKAVMPRWISVGLLASRCSCVGIDASFVVGCGHEIRARHCEIAAVEIHQPPRLVGGNHLPDTEVGFLYGFHGGQAFLPCCVVGIRTEHQPRFAVGL